MCAKQTKIAVIGGGIIGVTSALALIESIPDIDLTLISEKFSPNTTSDGSGGLIWPYLPGKNSPQRFNRWVSDTIRFLNQNFMSPNAAKLGIGLLSMYVLFGENEDNQKPESVEGMVSYRDMTTNELKLFGNKWKSGVFVTTYFAESSKMLPFFLQQIKSKGGNVIQKRINSLEELVGQYDIVINCTGVEASKLVEDKQIKPIRGQVFRVNAPWIKHAVLAGGHYIIPNSECVVLGGTKGYGDWNLDISPNDSKIIMDGCCQLFPSLKSAQIISEWVGLRPGREAVRLESEIIKKYGKETHVIHNYGHGGSGVTLSWGCAKEVQQIVKEIMATNFKSKL